MDSGDRRRRRVQLEALEAVYREADAAFAGWSCPSSTECCRFGITGREPYVTSIELEAIQRGVAARGGSRSWRRAGDAQPKALPVLADRPCPLLTDEGRCAVYADRPLGCRTFFCSRASGDARVPRKRITELVRAVQAIAADHAIDGDRGRPLSRALESA